MAIIEKYILHEGDKSPKCTYHDDVRECKVDSKYIIRHPAGWNIYLCEYCLYILLGEITTTILLSSKKGVEVEVVGGKETELRMPIYTFRCVTCNNLETKEMFGGPMVKHLRDEHGIGDEEAYQLLDDLVKQ